MSVFLLIVQVIYLMLPGIMANSAPVLFRHWKFADVPIDHGRRLGGKPLFGPHKTYRGFLVGIISAIIVAYLQQMLFASAFFAKLSLLPYDDINIFLAGFLMGFGVLSGDLVESFFKRRAGKPSGASWFPWDQLDSALGGIAFLSLIWLPSWGILLTVIILALFLHVGIRHIAYHLGINKSKW
ncbi:MAG: CDP-archaeol synthase [DPANN group archaeon]|nr:CDP-archaeol synthase [DPANN group archaeon]